MAEEIIIQRIFVRNPGPHLHRPSVKSKDPPSAPEIPHGSDEPPAPSHTALLLLAGIRSLFTCFSMGHHIGHSTCMGTTPAFLAALLIAIHGSLAIAGLCHPD